MTATLLIVGGKRGHCVAMLGSSAVPNTIGEWEDGGKTNPQIALQVV